MKQLFNYLFTLSLLTTTNACDKDKPAATPTISGSFSQEILNPGFENWDTTNVPTNWSVRSGSISQSTDSYSGSYAALIWTWYISITELLVNGDYSATGLKFKIHEAGTPTSVKPAYLQGIYKYTDVAPGDSAVAIVLLKKYDSIQSKIDTIGYGIKLLGPVNTYTTFQVDIVDLQPSVTPDSMVIAFSSSGNFLKSNVGDLKICDSGSCSYLYIDALSLK